MNIAHGAAGVLYALVATGAGSHPEHEEWLVRRALAPQPGTPLGFYDGLHGIAYVLDHFGRRDDALDLLETCNRELEGKLDKLGLDLYVGLDLYDVPHFRQANDSLKVRTVGWAGSGSSRGVSRTSTIPSASATAVSIESAKIGRERTADRASIQAKAGGSPSIRSGTRSARNTEIRRTGMGEAVDNGRGLNGGLRDRSWNRRRRRAGGGRVGGLKKHQPGSGASDWCYTVAPLLHKADGYGAGIRVARSN